MFRPSTAPRWKRQTKIGRREAAKGRRRAYAARPRNNGSSPRLTRASAPDLINTLRETVMGLLSLPPRRPPLPFAACLLLLKLRPANRQADSERASLRWIV